LALAAATGNLDAPTERATGRPRDSEGRRPPGPPGGGPAPGGGRALAAPLARYLATTAATVAEPLKRAPGAAW
jgi:hypothetical protein